MGRVGSAVRLFAGRPMKDRARQLAKLHPRMMDYIKQCPAIVAASRGEWIENYEEQVRALCEEGVKLRDMLGLHRLNPALRNVHGHAFDSDFYPALVHLQDAKPSAIAQQIAKRTTHQVGQYLKQLGQYMRRQSPVRDCGVPFVWMAENLPIGEHDMAHYADMPQMHIMDNGFRKTWRWKEFQACLKKWEESFRRPQITGVWYDEASSLDAMAYGIGLQRIDPVGNAQRIVWHDYRAAPAAPLRAPSTDPLTPIDRAPKEAEHAGYSFRLLNTEADLHREGHAMSHCVGGYGPKVKAGQSLIWSVSKDGAHLATMELTKFGNVTDQEWCFEQIKGYRNAKVAPATEAAALAFAKTHFVVVSKALADSVYRQMAADQAYFGRFGGGLAAHNTADQVLMQQRAAQSQMASMAQQYQRALGNSLSNAASPRTGSYGILSGLLGTD